MLERLFPAKYALRHPRGISAEQIHTALEDLADVVVEEVADKKIRTKILLQLDTITEQLAADEMPDQEVQI